MKITKSKVQTMGWMIKNFPSKLMQQISGCSSSVRAGIVVKNHNTARPPLWSSSNIIASHLAGPSSISGRVSFPGWDFFCGFPSTVRQMLGKLRPHSSLHIIGHHNHQKSFITDANDLWCRCALKPYIFNSIQYCEKAFHTYDFAWLTVVLLGCHNIDLHLL